MTPEIETAIRESVAAWKASGKKLERGTYETCLLAALGGPAEANKKLGYEQALALEVGFEGWNQGISGKLHPDFYALGKKIAEENGIK